MSYDSGKLFEALVTLKLDRTWTRPLAEFISHYQGQVARYNNMVFNASERLQPDMVKNMLQRAVLSVRGLREVKDREEHRIAEGQLPLSLSSYLQLLTVAAEGLDRERTRSRRAANVHQIHADSDDASTSETPQYDVNYTAGSRMNKSTWDNLSKAAQSTWDTLPDGDKAKILGYAEDRAARSASASGNPDRAQRSANVADICQDDTDDDESPPSDTESPPDSTSSLQVNKAIQSTKTIDRINELKGSAHPGDLRRVLGRQVPATPPQDSSTTGGDTPSTLKPSLKKPTIKPRTRNASNINWNVNNTEFKPVYEDELDSWSEPVPSRRNNHAANSAKNKVWTHSSDDESEDSHSPSLFR